jgi:type I restriction enzyme M protein
LQGVRDWLLEKFQLLAVVSLPQEAFQHAGAGVKASIVFVRKRSEREQPDPNEAIFMAAPANIGYDATGRKTASVKIKKADEQGKVEIHSTDLFDLEVTFEKAAMLGTGEQEWQEKSRRVVAGTGVLGQYHEFERRPERFFV